jgi:hypothetical protein
VTLGSTLLSLAPIVGVVMLGAGVASRHVWILAALVSWAGPAAADDCRKVKLDEQHPSAAIGVQPKIKNLGEGEVYISLASAPVKDLSSNPSDLYRLTGFVLGAGGAVGSGTGHIVISIDNSDYVVQLAKREVAATVEICTQP